MKHTGRLVLLAAFALALTPSFSGASVARSGLHGSVLRGSTMPVCRAGTPCTAPAAGVHSSFVRGSIAHGVRTNARGRFSIRLAPGTYTVRIAVARFGYRPLTATVSPRHMSVLNIHIDTGIR